MFALIISILAIILAVALAGVSVYYGGDAFSNGSERAAAATLTNQGSQVEAAMTLFRAENGDTAQSVASNTADDTETSVDESTWEGQLVGGNYLRQIPDSQFDPFEITADENKLISKNVGTAVCEAFENHETITAAATTDTLEDVLAPLTGVSNCVTVTGSAEDGNVFYYSI